MEIKMITVEFKFESESARDAFLEKVLTEAPSGSLAVPSINTVEKAGQAIFFTRQAVTAVEEAVTMAASEPFSPAVASEDADFSELSAASSKTPAATDAGSAEETTDLAGITLTGVDKTAPEAEFAPNPEPAADIQ